MLFFIFYILSFILFPAEEYSEWMGTKNWDINEHWISIFQRASIVLAGYYYPWTLIELPFLISFYWLMCDGLMNKMKKRKFFAVSNESGNPLEKLNSIKFSLIIIGIVLLIIF